MNKTGSPPSHWTLDEALSLIRAVQSNIWAFGYHLSLGGGVLNKGESKKDLDLYFLPMGSTEQRKPDALILWLDKMWGEGEVFGGASDPNYKDHDLPYVVKIKFFFDGLRIDAFILGIEEDIPIIEKALTDENDVPGTPDIPNRWQDIVSAPPPIGVPIGAPDGTTGTWGGIVRSTTPLWRSQFVDPPPTPLNVSWDVETLQDWTNVDRAAAQIREIVNQPLLEGTDNNGTTR